MGLVSDAQVRFSRVADGTDRGLRTAILSNSSGCEGNAGIAAAGVGLRHNHVFERPGPYLVLDSGTHGGRGDVSASSAGILFFAVSVRGVAMVDGAAAAHRPGGFPAANGRLKPEHPERRSLPRTAWRRSCYHLVRSNSLCGSSFSDACIFGASWYGRRRRTSLYFRYRRRRHGRRSGYARERAPQ